MSRIQGTAFVAGGSILGALGRGDERLIGNCSVVRVRELVHNTIRRSWSEIREEGADVAALCFVRKGSMRLAHAGGISCAKAGDMVVAVSTVPFEVDVDPGAGGAFEMMQLTVPTHVLRCASNCEIHAGLLAPAGSRSLSAAMRILAVISDESGDVPDCVAGKMLDALLPLIGSVVGRHAITDTGPRSIADRRLVDVLRYVESHLSDPRLSAANVALNCGISSRYLSALLRRRGATFLSLVCGKRLEVAGNWLAASGSAQASISEVAYRLGFKSPAHFSRVFRRQYKMSPSEYRERNVVADKAPLLSALEGSPAATRLLHLQRVPRDGPGARPPSRERFQLCADSARA